METGNVCFNSMTERTEDMKVQKGEFGYIRWQKKRRILVTLGLFLLPVAVGMSGIWISLPATAVTMLVIYGIINRKEMSYEKKD